MSNADAVAEMAQKFRTTLDALQANVRKVMVGHDSVIEHTLIGFIAGGHVLLEGVPGLGKTLLVRTVADSTHLDFTRIQFTPDLMPADITGTTIVVESPEGGRQFTFQKGPLFGHIMLADEVNRATPKTQSALLEAMAEGAVTVGGTRHELPQPFFVLATQNPIEMEGTYPLPEAQLDRFLFKLEVKTQQVDELVSIFERTTARAASGIESVVTGEAVLGMRNLAREVPIAKPLLAYVARLILGTHPETEQGKAVKAVKQYVRFGCSPRGGQAIILAAKIRALWAGRYNVSVDDIRAVAPPALRHRLILNFEGEAEQVHPDTIIAELIRTTPVD